MCKLIIILYFLMNFVFVWKFRCYTEHSKSQWECIVAFGYCYEYSSCFWYLNKLVCLIFILTFQKGTIKNLIFLYFFLIPWISYMLQYWEQHHLTYPIFFLTYVSSSTVDYVKSFLEWMSDSIAKSFEHTRDNAFLLK